MSPRLGSLLAALGLCVAGNPLLGQLQPLGLLHGLQSSAQTWHLTAVQLKGNLLVDTIIPELDWQAHYVDQSTALIGAFGSDAILIGHSNGGIVARMRAGDQELAGLATWGSPNAGAPLAVNFPWLVNYGGLLTSDAVNVLFSLTAYYAGADVLNDLEGPMDAIIQTFSDGLGDIADYLGVWYAPVLTDMDPASPFQSGVLNTPGHVAEERANVPTIVSASFTPEDSFNGGWYYGALWNVIAYDNAPVITSAIYGLAEASVEWAWYLDDNADWQTMDDDDWFALTDAKNALFWFAADLELFDAEYCADVTGARDIYGPLVSGPNDCPPNDNVVPQMSADLAWADHVYHFSGIENVHNRITHNATDLENVLQNDFGVAHSPP